MTVRKAVPIVLALALVWCLAGIRTLDPQTELGVLDGPLLFGAEKRVRGSWTVAPPGLVRLTLYPRVGVELPLPQAEEAALTAADGSLYGLRGFAMVRARPDRWRAFHEAAGGDGLRGALRAAVRDAAAGLPPVTRSSPVTPTLRADLESGLRAALDAIGIDLRSLSFDTLDFGSARADAGGAGDGGPPTKLLVVGLDGADWAILDPLLDAGRLPNLQRLIDDGVRAKLLSISPLLSPVIWTSVATGVEPTRHGVLDFLVVDPETGERQPVTSVQRKVPTFWEILSREGVESGVTAWWASWPADPLRGYMVSDRLAYQLFGFRADVADATGKTWPPDLYESIRPKIVAPESVPWSDVRPYLSGPRETESAFDEEERELLRELRTLIASGRTYRDIALDLSARFEPRLEVVYFEGTDTVGHLFMPYRPPALPGIAPDRIEAFGEVVDRYYETADRYLGQLLEGKGDDWTVMVLSDHGFASDATRPRTTDSRIGHGGAADWHRRFGILILSGARVRAGAKLEEARIYDVAPTVLALFGHPVPESWPGRVLGPALDPEFLRAHPVRYSAEDPVRRPASHDAASLRDPSAAALMEKLQTLGYIGPTAPGGAGTAGEGGGDSVNALNNQGVTLLAEGRYAEAEREFRRGLERSPDSALFRFNLALALRFQGREDEAERLLREALESPATLRMAGVVLVEMLLDRGRVDEAEEIVDRVLRFEPDSAQALTLAGRIEEARGDLAAARDLWERATGLDPDAALPRNHLGTLARGAGDLAAAERWYLEAIEADPYFMGAYNNLALVYQQRGERQRAIDLYGRALAKSPGNAVVINNLATLYYEDGDFDRAREQWERAAEADPTYSSPWNNLASLAIRAGEFDTALERLARALELDPEYGDARINRAIVLNAQGRTAEARAELERATRDPRAAAVAWTQLGLFELQQGDPQAAIRALETGVAQAPRHVPLWNALGEARRQAGDAAGAVEAWQRSLALQPGQAQIRRALEMLQGGG